MKKLHTRSKIFFKNPHVVRIDYQKEFDTEVKSTKAHKDICKKLYTSVSGTWGHTQLIVEYTYDKSALTFGSGQATYRAYFCFEDESDTLFLKLITNSSISVKIWPENINFTIHEYVNSE